MNTHPPIRHPSLGVFTVCITELWERFGYYTVTALLVLFMTKEYDYTDTAAYGIFAAYTALLFITPAIGGFFADRYIGYHRSLGLGLLLMIAGYALVALPSKETFYPGLSLVIIGTGFFKSMPYAIMGRIYQDDQTKLDKGCTYYYLAIQFGAIIPVAAGGFLARYFGWHFTFLIATIGITIGTIIFLSLRHNFKEANNTVGLTSINTFTMPLFFFGSLASAFAIANLLEHLFLTRLTVCTAALLVISYIIYYSKRLTSQERKRVLAAIILSSVAVIWTMLYLQQPTSMTLFVDRHVDRTFFGFVIPASAYWLFNCFWIFIMGPILTFIYTQRAKHNKDFSIPSKFAFGILCMSVGYGILCASQLAHSTNYDVSSWWIAISYAFQSTSELLINALGPSMILQFVPRQLTGVMMGVWFLAYAAGGLLSGTLAGMTAIPENIASASESLDIYTHAFGIFAATSLIFSVIYFLCIPFIKKMCGTLHEDEPHRV